MSEPEHLSTILPRVLERVKPVSLKSYFKVGVSDDYILMRRDFPMAMVSPGEFSKLLKEMFERNDEVRHGK